MIFYIREWSDKTASVMIDDDTSLWTFHDLETATNYMHWCEMNDFSIIYSQPTQDINMSTCDIG